MACAIEDAGFEIRDQLAWCFGSGFPKSHDVSKGIDRANGAVRQVRQVRQGDGTVYGLAHSGNVADDEPISDEAAAWNGWGTALKPAWEPICFARKPLSEKSVAANVLRWGTGAINVEGCRIETNDGYQERVVHQTGDHFSIGSGKQARDTSFQPAQAGRWPANVCHDGSEEVLAGFPETKSGVFLPHHKVSGASQIGTFNMRDRTGETHPAFGDTGSAARFFYSAKAGPLDRIGRKHPTVKPVDLMRWLCRLVTPPGGHVLDPFSGSGTTGTACMAEQLNCTLIELEAAHHADIERKLAWLNGDGRMTFVEHDRKLAHGQAEATDHGPLFA